MKSKIIPQEILKLIACITMLIDHAGHAIVPHVPVPFMVELYYACRIIGRIAFPIYAFLLAEGMRHTKSPQKYILRLGIGILLAELPFDFALFCGWTWENQSVMVTLTFGAVMLLCMGKTANMLLKQLILLLFAFAAELLRCDYGFWGIVMIGAFALMEKLPLQILCVLLISWLIPSASIPIFGINLSVQLFAVFAMVPIALYSGKKLTYSRELQWGFYLFYPLHLLILWMILLILR